MGRNESWELDLFVVDATPRSQLAYHNLKNIMRDAHKPCKIKLVDLEKNPRAAAEDEIVATPTIIRRSPKPQITLIGTLADKKQAMAKLGLKH